MGSPSESEASEKRNSRRRTTAKGGSTSRARCRRDPCVFALRPWSRARGAGREGRARGRGPGAGPAAVPRRPALARPPAAPRDVLGWWRQGWGPARPAPPGATDASQTPEELRRSVGVVAEPAEKDGKAPAPPRAAALAPLAGPPAGPFAGPLPLGGRAADAVVAPRRRLRPRRAPLAAPPRPLTGVAVPFARRGVLNSGE